MTSELALEDDTWQYDGKPISIKTKSIGFMVRIYMIIHGDYTWAGNPIVDGEEFSLGDYAMHYLNTPVESHSTMSSGNQGCNR